MKKICEKLFVLGILLGMLFSGIKANAAESYLWPIYNSRTVVQSYSASHRALDISATRGTEVHATKSGKVIASSNSCPHTNFNGYCNISNKTNCNGGQGNYVIVQHNDGTCSRYLHLLQGTAASVGTAVKQGTVIGKVGSSGNSYGYHLHFDLCSTAYWNLNNRFNPSSVSYIYTPAATNRAPIGHYDEAFGGNGTVRVRGWAYDPDSTGSKLYVDVYIGGPAGVGEGHRITANVNRPDVNKVYGCGNYHGFDATIKTNKKGSQKVYVYALDTNSKANANPCLGYKTVTVNSVDTTKPKITNVKVTKVNKKGYTVTCTATDNVGVTKVLFPTWRVRQTSSGCKWYTGTRSGNTWTFTFKDARYEDYYLTHIYAYDAAGNYGAVSIPSKQYCRNTAKTAKINSKSRYMFTSAVGKNMVMDIDIASSNAQIWSRPWYYNLKSKALNIKFYIKPVKNGWYKIVCAQNNKVLDVAGGSAYDCANIQLYKYNGTDSQLFRFVSAGNGYYYIISKLGTYVDVYGAYTSNGTNVQAYQWNESAAQKWKLTKVR